MCKIFTTSLFNLYLDENFEGLTDSVCLFPSEAILYLFVN